MSSITETARSTNYTLCPFCPKLQKKWVDIALALGCIACLTIGALATAGYFHAIGTVNATYLSWGMYAGSLTALLGVIAKIAVDKCLQKDEEHTHLKHPISDSVPQITPTELNDSDPLVLRVPKPNPLSTVSDNQKAKREPDPAVLKDKRETFLREAGSKKDLYLEGEDLKQVELIIQSVQMHQTPEMFKALLDQIRPHLKEYFASPHIQLVRAIVHEVLGNPLLAAEAYIHLLSHDIKNKEACIEKIKTLIDTECWQKNHQFLDFLENLDRSLLIKLGKLEELGNIFEKLLLQKNAVRMYFEKALLEIKKESQRQDQECFICFSLDSEVEAWLSGTFVPDLKQIGLKPVYGPWHLSHAMDLNSFQEKIRYTDLALIVCTASLKEKCANRVKAITGCIQEVRIALERYNDDEKAGTLFTLLLHGKRQDCIPRPILEPIFAAKTEVLGSQRELDLYDYYSKAFRIFASLVGMSIENAGNLKEAFYKKASEQVLEGHIDSELVKKWAEDRYKPKYIL